MEATTFQDFKDSVKEYFNDAFSGLIDGTPEFEYSGYYVEIEADLTANCSRETFDEQLFEFMSRLRSTWRELGFVEMPSVEYEPDEVEIKIRSSVQIENFFDEQENRLLSFSEFSKN
jgi:hypothetical protein